MTTSQVKAEIQILQRRLNDQKRVAVEKQLEVNKMVEEIRAIQKEIDEYQAAFDAWVRNHKSVEKITPLY